METVDAAATAEVMPPASPWEALPEGDYAIVELMGHTTLVGRVTEIEKFGAKMMAIEVLFGGQLLTPVLQGGSAIYRFTPCTPETAWKARHKPERAWELPDPIKAIVPRALLPAPTAAALSVAGDDHDDETPVD